MTAGHDTGKWLLGLMSGTSMDGIDAALIRSDGERVLECGESFFRPYSLPERERIEGCLLQKDRSLEAVRALEEEQTLWHVEAVEQLMQKAGLSASDIALIGFHGQTLWHNPADRETLQIGDGALLASRTGIAVINDFRAADVARGGEGAPFAPAYHAALARSAGGGQETVAFLNIGGVSNVTLVRGELDDRMLAFDLGPGNALMDDWARARTGQACDLDGEMAARGVVAQEVLSEALEHPFFRKSFPKSLDRNDFSLEFFASRIERSEDVMATLAAFTVKAIGAGEALLPEKPAKWFVTGGGRHNPVLMKALSEELSGEVQSVEARGWNGDVLEAQAFAYLALRSRLGLPLSWPGTTAVPEACQGGVLHQPA